MTGIPSKLNERVRVAENSARGVVPSTGLIGDSKGGTNNQSCAQFSGLLQSNKLRKARLLWKNIRPTFSTAELHTADRFLLLAVTRRLLKRLIFTCIFFVAVWPSDSLNVSTALNSKPEVKQDENGGPLQEAKICQSWEKGRTQLTDERINLPFAALMTTVESTQFEAFGECTRV
jgi:hypothetical protein